MMSLPAWRTGPYFASNCNQVDDPIVGDAYHPSMIAL
jgi:hypothetical protein